MFPKKSPTAVLDNMTVGGGVGITPHRRKNIKKANKG